MNSSISPVPSISRSLVHLSTLLILTQLLQCRNKSTSCHFIPPMSGLQNLHLNQIYLPSCWETLLISFASWLLHAIHWCALLSSLIKTPIRLSNLLEQLQPPWQWLLHHSNAQFIYQYWPCLLQYSADAVSIILGFFCLQQQQLRVYCNNFSSRCSLWPFQSPPLPSVVLFSLILNPIFRLISSKWTIHFRLHIVFHQRSSLGTVSTIGLFNSASRVYPFALATCFKSNCWCQLIRTSLWRYLQCVYYKNMYQIGRSNL